VRGQTWRADDGRITLLSLGFGVVLLTLVAVVAAASSIHIERKRLYSLADASAASAADAIDEALYYGGDDGIAGVPLTDLSVRTAVQEHLARAPVAGRFEALQVVEPTGTEDSRTAVVSLRAIARPVLVPWVLIPWSDGIEIRATSRGRSELQ